MKRTVVVVAVFVVVSVVVSVVPAGVAAGGNEAPLADAGLDQEAEVGETVLLDATGSRDPDGHVGSYEWLIETPGGTTVRPADPTDPRTRFVVREHGRYEVTVRVTDDHGATTADTLYVDVTGSGESESSSSSSDVSVISTGGSAGGTALAGPVDSALDLVPWIDVSGPGTVKVGETATFGARVGGFESAPTVTWTGGDSGRTATVLFRAPGTYPVTAYASDGEETVSDFATVRVVRNEPPTVDIRAPENLEPGEAVTLSAVARDPDGRVVRRVWSPGRTVVVPEERSSETVTVTVYDNDGATAQDAIAITNKGKLTENLEPKQVKCAWFPTEALFLCQVGNKMVKFRHNRDGKIGEWKRSDEYEFDMVSQSVVLSGNPTLEDPGAGIGGSAAVKYIDDRSLTTEANSVAKRATTQKERVFASKPMKPYTLHGKTVSSDLTGDWEIDDADWERKYGKQNRNTMSARKDAQIIERRQSAKQEAISENGDTVTQNGRNYAETYQHTDSGSADSDSPTGAHAT